jgi:hypothetical protein
MTPNDTAKLTGTNPPQVAGGRDRTKTIAVCAAVAAAIFAGASAFFHYQRNLYEIENKIFDVHVDDSWTITIEQIGGPTYPIRTVRMTPTFEERIDNRLHYVDGAHIEIPMRELQAYTDKGLTRYVIDNPKQLLCPPNRPQPKLSALCTEAELFYVRIEFDVSGDRRTYACDQHHCTSS